MDKLYFEKLKNGEGIDSKKVASELADELRVLQTNGMFHAKAVSIAYLLYKLQNGVVATDFQMFLKSACISEKMKNSLEREASDSWDIVTNNINKFTDDELLSFILFDNSLENYKGGYISTPSSILKLASTILDVQKNEKMLELCCGKSNMPIEIYGENQNFEYTGIEINYSSIDISIIRNDILGINAEFIFGNAFEFESETKADKLFANYPFMLRNVSENEYKNKVIESLNITDDTVKKASTDWMFNLLLIENMKDAGKAIAIMTNGDSWNTADRNIRQYFVENGYIEAIISLPEKMFADTNIATTLMVFSKNNTEVRMIDATEMCIKERKGNVFSDEHIKKIVSLLNENSEKSVVKSIKDIADKEYELYAPRYFESLPMFEKGITFDKVIKNIIRGSQLKADELDELKSDTPTDYQYFMLGNINDHIAVIDNGQYLKEIPKNLEKYCIKNNSIVISKIGIPNFKSAVVQVDDKKKLLANGNIFIIEVDEKIADPFYIQAFLESNNGKKLLQSVTVGSTVTSISVGKLKEIIIPDTPLDVQKKIGAKYAAKMDEVVLLKRRLNRIIEDMGHILDEEE